MTIWNNLSNPISFYIPEEWIWQGTLMSTRFGLERKETLPTQHLAYCSILERSLSFSPAERSEMFFVGNMSRDHLWSTIYVWDLRVEGCVRLSDWNYAQHFDQTIGSAGGLPGKLSNWNCYANTLTNLLDPQCMPAVSGLGLRPGKLSEHGIAQFSSIQWGCTIQCSLFKQVRRNERNA